MKMSRLQVSFFGFALFFVVLAAFYLQRRLRVSAGSERFRRVRYLVPALVTVSLLGLWTTRRFHEYTNALWFVCFQWLSYLALGTLGFLLCFVLLADIIHIAQIPFSKAHDTSQSRRHFLSKLGLGTLFGLTSGVSLASVVEARWRLKVDDVVVPLDSSHAALDGLCIVQISDVHVGSTIQRDYIETIVALVKDAGADLICLTGDVADGYPEEIGMHLEPLRSLSAPLGCYYITGNHEYYWGAEPWVEFMRTLGFEPLMNEHRVLNYKDALFVLAGVTDLHAERFSSEQASDPKKALQGAPEEHFKLLLAHQPGSAFEAADLGYHLQLSGHTHGGQLFPWGLLVYLVQPFVRGLYKHKSMWLYVNRGTGYWGPPMRLGATPEITRIRLSAKV